MTEHVWKISWVESKGNVAAWQTKCVKCGKYLHPEETEARINAVERLSAEDAKVLLGDYPETHQENMQAVNALRAYADILEAKPFAGGTVGTYFDTSRPEEK